MSLKEKKIMVNITFCDNPVYCVVYYDGKSKDIAMPVNSTLTLTTLLKGSIIITIYTIQSNILSSFYIRTSYRK